MRKVGMPGPRAPEEERREQILGAAHEVALRSGIDSVTLRAVAAEAKLSHGLVIFYFKRKDQLIDAILDRTLMTTAMLDVPDEIARIAQPAERLSRLVDEELERLMHDPRGIRLFFEYWALGVRHAAIRDRIGAAMERYRAAFRKLAEDLLPESASEGRSLTPDSFAALAVSLINGFAVQSMLAPGRFDSAAYATAVRGLIEQIASGADSGRPPRTLRAQPV